MREAVIAKNTDVPITGSVALNRPTPGGGREGGVHGDPIRAIRAKNRDASAAAPRLFRGGQPDIGTPRCPRPGQLVYHL